MNNLEQELEEAIKNYAEPYRCPATNDNEYCRHDIISAINFGANSDIVKKIHQQEAVELIRELTERVKSITDDYVLAPDDAQDNEETITKAENFLNKKQ
jgi:hypothetical protein